MKHGSINVHLTGPPGGHGDIVRGSGLKVGMGSEFSPLEKQDASDLGAWDQSRTLSEPQFAVGEMEMIILRSEAFGGKWVQGVCSCMGSHEMPRTLTVCMERWVHGESSFHHEDPTGSSSLGT